MNQPRHRNKWIIWVGLVLAGGTILLAYLLAQVRAYYGPSLPVRGGVADFTLTNQLGKAVSLADLRGQVWLADIIFTRCPGPCKIMSREMSSIQQALPASSRAKLVSLTADPEYDTPAVLAAYAKTNEADPNRWLFLTGAKKQVNALAVDSLKLTAIENKPEPGQDPADLFVHSTIFVLVDKQAQLRGYFETTGEAVDWQATKARILAGIRRLEREP